MPKARLEVSGIMHETDGNTLATRFEQKSVQTDRSAASLAIQCGRYREAEQLIAKALSGNPTEEIARELRQLLQNIYAQSGRDEDVVVYQLEVPDRDRTRFEGILHQLGLAASNMRKVIGKVALL